MRSGKLYWPNTLLKSLARPARQAPQRSPFTQNMSRSLLRLAACAGLFVSLCLPSVVHSQAASAPNFVMVIHGGAGTYANNLSCAVSGTGDGEFFIRNNVAADICARVRYSGVSLQQAADDVVMKELVAQNGGGGVIAMDRKGNIATPFNTPGMYRAWVTSDGKITVKIYKD